MACSKGLKLFICLAVSFVPAVVEDRAEIALLLRQAMPCHLVWYDNDWHHAVLACFWLQHCHLDAHVCNVARESL